MLERTMEKLELKVFDKPDHITEGFCVEDSTSSHLANDCKEQLQHCSADEAGKVWYLIELPFAHYEPRVFCAVGNNF